MITYLINQVVLAGFNLINSRLDAYRIMKRKNIAHGINFGAYFIFAILLFYLTEKPVLAWATFPYFEFAVFLISAFTNRQFSFDIPLNRRRSLPADYVTPAKPPKALLDRIEIRIWGYDGRAPLVCYGIIWILCLIINFFL